MVNADSITAGPPERTRSYAWYIAGMMGLAYLLSILDRYLLGVVQEDVKRDLALSDTQLGILQGPSFVLLFVLASVPFGRLADTASRVRTIVAGLVIWSLATAACGMADTFVELLLARLTIGLGEAALLPSAMSLITAYFSRDKFHRGVSIFSMGSTFGRVVAFSGGGAALAWYASRGGLQLPGFGHFAPWQATFLGAAVLGILFAVIFVLTIREPPRARTTGAQSSLRAGVEYFWQRRRAYLAIFVPFGMTTAMAALLASWSVSFYMRRHGLTAPVASNLIGLTGLIAGPPGHLLGGWLNDWLRARGIVGVQPWILAALLSFAAIFAAVFALTQSIVLAAGIYGCAYMMLCAAGPTGFGGTQLPTPDRFRGVMASIFLLVYNFLANVLGPLLVGLISDHVFNQPKLLGYSIAVSIGILLAIGLPFALSGRQAFADEVRSNESQNTA